MDCPEGKIDLIGVSQHVGRSDSKGGSMAGEGRRWHQQDTEIPPGEVAVACQGCGHNLSSKGPPRVLFWD